MPFTFKAELSKLVWVEDQEYWADPPEPMWLTMELKTGHRQP
jgi:hypothetical protein